MDEMQDSHNNSVAKGVPVHFVSRQEQAWTDKGNAAAERGDYEAAVEAFEQAVEANPSDARARYNLALAQQYLGDAEMAIAGIGAPSISTHNLSMPISTWATCTGSLGCMKRRWKRSSRRWN